MKYTSFILLLLSALASNLVHAIDLDFEDVNTNHPKLVFHSQLPSIEQTPGVSGQALRLDGFSSFLEIAHEVAPKPRHISFWVALESYPSDFEVLPNDLVPSSFINKRDNDMGFDIFIDTYGRWGIWLGNGNEQITLRTTELFPLYQWAHISANISSNHIEVYLNGERVIEHKSKEAFYKVSNENYIIGKAKYGRTIIDVFDISGLNAAFDDLAIDAQWNSNVTKKEIPTVNVMKSLAVPESRFANDHLRPKFHGMPPANWTNEPHGLVKKNDTYHLFYQRTPNGPYKTQMHWGHLISKDLVNWENVQDALWPELQNAEFGWDQKGIWSGDVIVEGDLGIAFYTSVNHYDRLTAFNPGISMATSSDDLLIHWEKHGPIINTKHVKDFRDPYIFKKGTTLHMLIGAAYKGFGGLDYWVWDADKTEGEWKHKSRFSELSYERMDIGSIIWEMPVFEPLEGDIHVLVVNPIGGAVEKYGELATRGLYWIGEWKDERFYPFYKDGKLLDILPGHLSPTVERGPDGYLRAIGIVDERRTPQAQNEAGWAHTFSFPRKWFLMPDKLTLGQAPAPELETLRGDVLFSSDLDKKQNEVQLSPGNAYELFIDELSFEGKLTIELMADSNGTELTKLIFDQQSQTITFDKSKANLANNDEGPLMITGEYDNDAFGDMTSIRVYVDGSIIEVFINDAAAFSVRSYPSKASSNHVKIVTKQTFSAKLKQWALSK